MKKGLSNLEQFLECGYVYFGRDEKTDYWKLESPEGRLVLYNPTDDSYKNFIELD